MFFLFKQKTAYEMRISDWSSDVCSSDLPAGRAVSGAVGGLGDGIAILELGAEGGIAARVRVVARTDPHDTLEQTLQMPGADLQSAGDLSPGPALAVLRVDQAAGPTHQRHLPRSRGSRAGRGALGSLNVQGRK